jgi:uncharacterized protein (DUF2249 family)
MYPAEDWMSHLSTSEECFPMSKPTTGSWPILLDAEPTTLTAEHALLLEEVTKRTTDVLSETARGNWPQTELTSLLDYLHLEVLRQVVDEEWLMFGHFHHDEDNLAQLRREHLELRRVIALLADAMCGESHHSVQQVSDTVAAMMSLLQIHLEHESRLLRAGSETPSTSQLGQTPHTWFALVNSPVVDMDLLPGRRGAEAVLARVLRLRGGEEVELDSSCDLSPMQSRLSMADPGGYGYIALRRGPPRWRLQIVRRSSR